MSSQKNPVIALMLLMAAASSADAQNASVDCRLSGNVIQCAAAGSARAQLRAATFIAGSEAAGETLAQAIALEVGTAPFGSSSGGFTFTFEPDTRLWRRTAGTFGPAFTERALTIGRGRLSAGFNYLRRQYDTVDTFDLDDLEVFRFEGGTLPVTSSRFALEASTDTLAVFAHYGVLDNLDVGLLVPYLRFTMKGTARIFGQRNEELQSVALDASTSGLGDIAAFAKFRFLQLGAPPAAGAEPNAGLALAVTLRLPTADEEQLHGLGVTRTMLSLIGSGTIGRLSPHASIGYEAWSGGIDIPRDFQGLSTVSAKDQVQYAAGVEYEVNPRLTLVGDVLGRYLRGAGGVGYQDFLFPRNLSNVRSAVALVAIPEGLHTVLLAPGVKWNAFGSALLAVNVLVPVSGRGLRDRMTPAIGIDWAF